MAKSKAPAAKEAGQGQRRGSHQRRRQAAPPLPGRRLGLPVPRLPRVAADDAARRVPINAVYGFCRMLVADLLDKPEVDHIAMISTPAR